jgi:hypothetical protein
VEDLVVIAIALDEETGIWDGKKKDDSKYIRLTKNEKHRANLL